MPIYFFWGEDEFRLKQAVENLRDRTLDAAWATFNYDRITPDVTDGAIQALNLAMTPPFGAGHRLVWLVDTALSQRCSEATMSEMARTLPLVPETTVLLLTSSGKPDGRLKSTKLLKKHADIREFAAIAPWQTDQLIDQVRRVAQEMHLRLKPEAAALLAEAVGADTRRLYNELEKLSVYWSSQGQVKTDPLPPAVITRLVAVSTQTSFQLAESLIAGRTDQALGLVTDLLANNEPALKVVATLVGQFRRWLWVSLMAQQGERDVKAIAKAAEINNPRRVYILQKQIRGCSSAQLGKALSLLLGLEFSLKRGAPEEITLQTKVIEIAACFGT
ncbi:DNA polymerase III subunit delta [cf. Phormidesmis sp. LEGE 11477]|uniref:DNA polymerase III subunit delta n=1 Tax=cf. Phormidesmis sp. LEGE 11477 TaxID=1828680 RepID=UPI00187E1875|nr:DNA polymerase III subunit delta [cf. Phormidesmis sp. LEGE 11477]MBE9064289.1 DNA polymerase III subunit delta [cf. Phormidesmis sp. LEGE 11477]